MRDDELHESWAKTEYDLRWVIAHSTLPPDCVRWATENLDHNEFGVAWEAINHCLTDPTPEVEERMEAARRRMGL